MTPEERDPESDATPVPAEDASRAAEHSESVRGGVFTAMTATSAAAVVAAYVMAPVIPIVAAASAGVAVIGLGVAMASRGVAPLRVARTFMTALSLRKKTFVEGVTVPLATVRSPEGDCCAFDHVVRRCAGCDCVRPCDQPRVVRWEERIAGRFLVRGEDRVVSIDRTDVQFVSTFREKATHHFLRLDAGERVRMYGDFEECHEPSDDVRAILASHRAQPRVLVPRAKTAVLVEKLG